MERDHALMAANKGRESGQAAPDYGCSSRYSALDHYLETPDMLSPWLMVGDFGKNNRPNDFSDRLWF